MVHKVYLDIDENKPPVIFGWDEIEQDFVFQQIPNNLTRCEMIQVIDEVKRITEWT